MKIYSHTIQGKRAYQQDRFHVEEGRVIVADGMGGHANGDLAAQAVVNSVLAKGKSLANVLESLSIADDQCINAHDGRGSTAIVAAFKEDSIFVCSVGDSPVYHCNLKDLKQFQAHCLPVFVLDEDPYSGSLTNGIGFMSRVSIQIANLRPGDVYILATDGVTISPVDISKMLRAWDGVSNFAQELVEVSYNAGSSDNITAVVLHA